MREMMKFVLIIMLVAGSDYGGVSLEKVEGFTSLASCQSEAEKISGQPFGGWVQAVKAQCIGVK